MKYPLKKVFILENGEYTEISYDELIWRTTHDITYEGRKFLPLHGMLMEVSEEDYNDFYKVQRRQRYLIERSAHKRDLSIDAPMAQEITEMLVDTGMNVSESVEQKIMLERMNEAISYLNRDEQLLIYQYYYAEIPESRLAEIYGISQPAISKRIDRICRKLKEIIE